MKLKLVIDAGSYYIKFIEGWEDRKGFFIKNIGYVANPVENIKDTEDERAKETFVNFIRKTFELKRIKAKQTISSLSGSNIIIHIFEIPNLPEEEIESAVKLEIMQVVPEGIKNLDYDYFVIPQKEKKEIVFVGYPKNKILSFVEILKNCRLNPIIIDHDCLAIYNFMQKYEKGKSIIFSLNIGYTTTNFLLAEKNGFILIRDVPYGIRNFISAICENENIPFNEGEIYFKKKENTDTIKEILKNSLSDYFSEIKTGIEYFKNNVNKAPEKVYITGGGALWEGITSLFEEMIEIKAGIFNPFDRIKNIEVPLDIRRKGTIFTVACGLMGREI